MTKCIYCGSENIYYSKKRGVYICEDCEKSFTPEEEVFHSRRIFLSYGHDENAELVKLIYDRLKERGHDPWIDYAKIKTGNDWRENITQGILGSNGFLAFLSKYSVRVPGVCLDEISIGVGNYNCRINSILLEKNVVPPNSISNIQYLDMSDWKEIKADPDPGKWDKWFGEKMGIITELVEDDKNLILAGNIDFLQKQLDPVLSSLKLRQILQKEIIPRNWLVSLVKDAASKGSAVVYGSPGTGKSVLSAYLCNFSTECVVSYFFEWNNSTTLDPERFVKSVIFQLACSLEDYQSLVVDILKSRDISMLSLDEIIDILLLQPLNMLIDGGRERKIMVFDAVDEAVSEGLKTLDVMKRIMAGLPSWMSVLITSRPEAAVTDNLRQFTAINIDDHADEMRADIGEYVSLAIKDPEVSEKIIKKSDGSFIYAREMIRLLGQTSFDIDELPSGLEGAYFTNFRRLFGESDEYQKLYRPLFETMLAARQQLSEDEICSVLCISPEELKMRLRKLRSYVFEMNQGDDVVLQLFHKSFLEWLSSESAGIYRVSMANGNRLFRDYIFRLMEEGAEFTPYLVRFSLDHFSMEEWDDIEEIDKSSVLDRMLKGAGTYGFLDLEKKYLKVYDDELGRDFCYYMHLLEYYKKTSGVQLKIAVDEALEYIKEHGGDEQQSFDLVSQAAYAYFYAGQEEKSYDLILAEREKHSDDFWTKGINDANYWHVVALTAHDLDNNLEVVKAAGNDVKDYKKQKRYYDLFCSMVNLFDGYMALGDLQRADEIAEDVMTRIEDRYYIHADDIVKICYANLLQTEGRIMESLDYYESGLKIASQIHDWDYLYGSIWRELAVARFGDRSCFAALEKYRKRAEENSYRYLMSLADCFTILSAYLLGDIEKLGDDKIYSRLKEYAFPGHLLQAYCCRVLAGKEKLDPEYLLSLTEKCEGVKGEPTVVRSVLDKYEKDLREAQKHELTEWCNNYVSSILSYREAFEENLVQGLPEEPMLTASACGSCQSVCCYDGVYLTKEEEKLITDFVKQNREHFSFLKEPFVVDGDWPGMRSKRKTEMVERDDYDESFPCHFTKTRCVFELSDGQCSLQRLATDLQLHPWRIKPAACWRFPIRDPKDGSIEPPVTNKDKDPDYVDENYPGYVSFLPCVKSDEEGISWIRKYRNEIEYMRYLEKKGK